MLHDNVHPHVAHRVQGCLHAMLWEVLKHPVEKPDLVTYNFHIFTPLNKVFRGHTFKVNVVEVAKVEWGRQKPEEFFADMICQLVHMGVLSKCL
jgi:hypothetical protein